jgi:hypothetical protein
MRIEDSKHQNPTSPELEALQRKAYSLTVQMLQQVRLILEGFLGPFHHLLLPDFVGTQGCQEHGIFKLFIKRSFFEHFLPFLMFECFTLFTLHSPIIQTNKRAIHSKANGTTRLYYETKACLLYNASIY